MTTRAPASAPGFMREPVDLLATTILGTCSAAGRVARAGRSASIMSALASAAHNTITIGLVQPQLALRCLGNK